MFPGSLVAVQAAIEIQRDLAEHDVPVRIGIHVGEVTARADVSPGAEV
jgi:class 3 adenylate cyclase